jgi:hypothetical protein
VCRDSKGKKDGPKSKGVMPNFISFLPRLSRLHVYNYYIAETEKKQTEPSKATP